MELHFDRIEDCVIVRLRGRLDRWTSGDLETRLSGELAPPLPAVALDCTRLEYVSSAGLRVLLGAAKVQRAAGRTVALFGVQPMVREVFDMSGFSDFLAIVLDETAALTAAKSKPRSV